MVSFIAFIEVNGFIAEWYMTDSLGPLLAAKIYNVLKTVIQHKTVCGSVKDHERKRSLSGQKDEIWGFPFFTSWINIMG